LKFGAIDIGSNAVRLLIADVTETENDLNIEKTSLVRVPVRLGSSVFEKGSISSSKAKQLAKTMKAFRYLMDVHGVKAYRACATSAMREADNSEEVRQRVKEFSKVDIDIITGHLEANLILSTFKSHRLDPAKSYLYVDVGGGSTEITLLKNKKRVRSRSFKIGTVRLLKKKVKQALWDDMREWLTKLREEDLNDEITAIGTGGNINRYFKMSGHKYGELLHLATLEEMHLRMKKMTLKERMLKLRMRNDRADVIVHAGDIYTAVMRTTGVHEISVPQMGLSDGIALDLFRKHHAAKAAAGKAAENKG